MAASGDFHRRVLDSVRGGVIAIDCRGRVEVANANAAAILALQGEAAQLLGQELPRVLRDYPELARMLREAISGASLPSRAEITLRTPDCQETRILGFSLARIRDGDGTVIGAAIFFKDLTRIEQQHEASQLKERLAALGQMAAGLAHEIRNPLAGIGVAAGLLRKELSEPEAVGDRAELIHCVDDILTDVGRLNETVASCLDFVRPFDLNFERCELQRLLDEAISSSCAGCPAIEVKRDYAQDPLFVSVDPQQILQAFGNLIRNAVEAMGQGGLLTVQISIESAADGQPLPAEESDLRAGEGQSMEARIEFEDSGPGIERRLLEKIFYPFFTTKQGGSGIGLSLVQKIVDGHGGRIDAESEPGAGTRFIVRLPIITHGECEDDSHR